MPKIRSWCYSGRRTSARPTVRFRLPFPISPQSWRNAPRNRINSYDIHSLQDIKFPFISILGCQTPFLIPVRTSYVHAQKEADFPLATPTLRRSGSRADVVTSNINQPTSRGGMKVSHECYKLKSAAVSPSGLSGEFSYVCTNFRSR